MNSTKNTFEMIEPYLVAYYAFSLIILGTIFNIFNLIIFSRGKFRETNERPTIHYMRAIAVMDILMLYGWNLDHYSLTVHGYMLWSKSIVACKILMFINYFAPQTSAWLRVFICLDRYLSLSRLYRTWFGHSKNVLRIIFAIVIVFAIFNVHLFVLTCGYNRQGLIIPEMERFDLFPLWDWVNLGLYNCVPFILMVSLNSAVIYHLVILRRSSTIQNSRLQHRSISITLLITTILFMIFTIPPTISYGFFADKMNISVLHLLDSLMYTYHVIAFPLYLISFGEFRQEFFKLISKRSHTSRIQPQIGLTKTTVA